MPWILTHNPLTLSPYYPNHIIFETPIHITPKPQLIYYLGTSNAKFSAKNGANQGTNLGVKRGAKSSAIIGFIFGNIIT